MNKKYYIVWVCIFLLGFWSSFLFPLSKNSTDTYNYTTLGFPEEGSSGTLRKYLEDVLEDPKKFNTQDVSVAKVGEFDDLYWVFNDLKNKHPDVMEKILSQATFSLIADSRISLEWYIYDRFKNNKPFEPEVLRWATIDSIDQMSMVLREIYLKSPEQLTSLVRMIPENYQSDQYQWLRIVKSMMEYSYNTPDYFRQSLIKQNGSFYEWVGWKYDLSADEKILLFEGKSLLDRFSRFAQSDIHSDIETEIKTMEEYLSRYDKTKLPVFYWGTINLYTALADLYGMNWNFDQAISIAHKTTELSKHLVPRRERSLVYKYPGIISTEGIEWRFYWIRAQSKEKNNDNAGALLDYKKAEELVHSNLLSNPFGLFDIFRFWQDVKVSIENMGG